MHKICRSLVKDGDPVPDLVRDFYATGMDRI
jgi:hypothetical protein